MHADLVVLSKYVGPVRALHSTKLTYSDLHWFVSLSPKVFHSVLSFHAPTDPSIVQSIPSHVDLALYTHVCPDCQKSYATAKEFLGQPRKSHRYLNWRRQIVTENRCPGCDKTSFTPLEGDKWHFARSACSESRSTLTPAQALHLPYLSSAGRLYLSSLPESAPQPVVQSSPRTLVDYFGV